MYEVKISDSRLDDIITTQFEIRNGDLMGENFNLDLSVLFDSILKQIPKDVRKKAVESLLESDLAEEWQEELDECDDGDLKEHLFSAACLV